MIAFITCKINLVPLLEGLLIDDGHFDIASEKRFVFFLSFVGFEYPT